MPCALIMGWCAAALAGTDGPNHVMSLSQCTDALLLDLLPPERIASVTYLSRQPDNAVIWPQGNTVAINYGSAEEVLAAKPDLVLAGIYTTPAARALMRQVGTPLLEVSPANSFADIRSTTRSVAHALGREAVAERLIATMDATLRELNASKPQRVIRVAGWDGSGSVPGRGTLFDAILSAAGGTNVAARTERDGSSFDLEELLMARPDVLAYGSDSSATPSLHTEEALHPLILKLYAGRRIAYPSALYACGVVESANAAVVLRSSLLRAMQRASDGTS